MKKEHNHYRTGLHVLVQRWMQRTSSCPCSRLSARRTLLRASHRVHLAILVRRPFFCSAEMRTACKMRLQRTLMNASSAQTCFRTPLVSGPAKRLPARSQSRSAHRNPERVYITQMISAPREGEGDLALSHAEENQHRSAEMRHSAPFLQPILTSWKGNDGIFSQLRNLV